MARLIALFIFGVIAGGGVVAFTASDRDPDPDLPDGSVSGALPEPAVSIERDVNALPPADRFAVEADALAARAEQDLAGALAGAMAARGDSLRRLLLIEVGKGAARSDPIAALAAAAGIDNLNLRSGITLGVLNEWAALDPVGLLDWLETADPNEIRAPIPFDRLVSGDPAGVLARLADYPAGIRRGIELAALLALAETDAIGSLARLDGMPAGRDRTALLLAVAETYGRQDPGSALAWATSLSPPSAEALAGVIDGVASVDVNRAIDWVLREVESPTIPGLNAAEALSVTPLFQGLRAGTLPMPRTAENLLASGDPILKSRATAVIMVWSQTNPDQAVDFALSQLDRLTPSDLTTLAMQTATSAPELAMRTPDRLPPDFRASWVAGVADALVRTRPERALDFLGEQRGQPGYEQGVVAVVRQLAAADPPAAAALLADAGSSAPIDNAALTLASAWGRQDPQAAATWALSLERAPPLAAVASAWASGDAGAAERWALGLPGGEQRDAGITGVITAAANSGDFDPGLLAALSSDAVRQQAASRAIVQIARSDQARARALMDAHLSDPALRQQMEQQLQQLARMGAAGGNTPRLPNLVMPPGALP